MLEINTIKEEQESILRARKVLPSKIPSCQNANLCERKEQKLKIPLNKFSTQKQPSEYAKGTRAVAPGYLSSMHKTWWCPHSTVQVLQEWKIQVWGVREADAKAPESLWSQAMSGRVWTFDSPLRVGLVVVTSWRKWVSEHEDEVFLAGPHFLSSLLPDCRCNITIHLTLLPLCLPWWTIIIPYTVSQNKPFFS